MASVGDGDLHNIDIVSCKSTKDPVSICLEAARRLRKLADDFERLSAIDEPFKEKTQRAIIKAAN